MFLLLLAVSRPSQESVVFYLPSVSSSSSHFGYYKLLSRKLSSGSITAQASPSIVVVIIILTIIFFLSAFLHLLIRCLARNPRRNPNRISLTAFEGQLQQLFDMHDSGIDQALIDALPVFIYNAVTGLKEGADCAVCLCEFQSDDRLRLLPSCRHAFHTECIDTWLVSHSTCPLCRRGLQTDFWELPNSSGQDLLQLDSSRSSTMGFNERNGDLQAENGTPIMEFSDGLSELSGNRSQREEGLISSTESRRHSQRYGSSNGIVTEGSIDLQKLGRISAASDSGRRVSVQLGKCRIIENSTSGVSSSRRSYSKGSYEYVVGSSNLEVLIDAAPYRIARTTTSSRRIDLPFQRTTLSAQVPETDYHVGSMSVFSETMASCWATSASFRRSRLAEEKKVAAIDHPSILHLSGVSSVELDSTATSMRADAGSEPSLSPEKDDRIRSILTANHKSIPDDSSPKRAVSFRIPGTAFTDPVLKASASRRTLSETEVGSCWAKEEPHFFDHGPTQADHHLHQQRSQHSVCADHHSVIHSLPSVVPSSGGAKLMTMGWFLGWQKRTVHPAAIHIANPVVDLPPV